MPMYRMPIEHLRERINQLCAKAVEAGPEQLQPAIDELRNAIRDYGEQMKKVEADSTSNPASLSE